MILHAVRAVEKIREVFFRGRADLTMGLAKEERNWKEYGFVLEEKLSTGEFMYKNYMGGVDPDSLGDS